MQLETIIANLHGYIEDAVLISEAENPSGGAPRILWCNHAFTEMTGYTPEEIIGKTAKILQGNDTDPEARADIRSRLATWQPIRQVMRNYRRDGTPFWVDLSIRPVADETGWYHYWVAMQRDITDQAGLHTALSQAREEAQIASQRLWSAIEALPEAFVLYDSDDRLVVCNEQYRRIYEKSRAIIQPGSSFEEILRSGLKSGQYPEAAGREEDWLVERLARHRNPAGAIEQRLPGNRHLKIHEVRTDLGDTVGFRVDVTQIKRQQQELQRYALALKTAKARAEAQANTDSLTGLGNRRSLDSRLAVLTGTAARVEDGAAPPASIGVLHIDLDRFKHVNDTLGHDAGDLVLQRMAVILEDACDPGDFIARIGGDEFVVVREPPADHEGLEATAGKIQQALREPMRYEDTAFRITASIGIALTNPEEAEGLLVDADKALYEAKKRGRNQVARFTNALRSRTRARLEVARHILEGIEQKRFQPYFQPQICATTGTIAGVEALARWDHPEQGIVEPAEFLDVAEDLGVVGEIDALILERGLAVVNTLRADGFSIPKISVNVSFRRLVEPDLLKKMAACDFGGVRVAFELLEAIFFDEQDSSFNFTLDGLRECGIEIELDDFGSGRASITGLMKVRPDRMKIDRQLISPMIDAEVPRRLVASMIEIGRILDIGVIAEGVETAGHAALLTDLGCSVLQGYHFSRPLSGDELHDYLAANHGRVKPERAAS